jgi:hypothetical protein
MKNTIIKNRFTWFLRGVIFVMAVVALIIMIFGWPSMTLSVGDEFPALAYLHYPLLIGGYIASIPFFIALYQALLLLKYIDKNEAFSEKSVKALRHIKYCGVIMSLVLYATLLPLFFGVAHLDDAPGAFPIGVILTSVPMVIAVFATLLEQLLKNAIEIKAESDLVI